jgi:hypothetical protein
VYCTPQFLVHRVTVFGEPGLVDEGEQQFGQIELVIVGVQRYLVASCAFKYIIGMSCDLGGIIGIRQR